MIRPLLHFLSGSSLAKKFVLNFPLARRVARRYVAGERLEDALNVTRKLKEQGLLVALDLLGENAVRKSDADKATEDYLVMISKVGESGLDCYFSLKLTQLGLDQGVDVALANLTRILEKAQALNLFVRIDMEASKYTEQTVEVFRKARERFENVGIVIQAYMRQVGYRHDQQAGRQGSPVQRSLRRAALRGLSEPPRGDAQHEGLDVRLDARRSLPGDRLAR